MHLKQYPQLGRVEEALSHLNQGHRYLLEGNYKIIYRLINPNILAITDIFDTRQNPDKLSS